MARRVREYCTIRRWPSRLVTNREQSVMEYLWEQDGSVTFRQIRRFVPGHPKTLRTFVDRLVRKGYVTVERSLGHRFRFLAKMSPREVFHAQATANFHRIFGPNIAGPFEIILRSRRSSPALKRIVRVLQKNEPSPGMSEHSQHHRAS